MLVLFPKEISTVNFFPRNVKSVKTSLASITHSASVEGAEPGGRWMERRGEESPWNTAVFHRRFHKVKQADV